MRKPVAFAAPLVAVTIALTACGSGSTGGSDTAVPGESTTTSSMSGVEVSGELGAKPEIEIPDTAPSAELLVEVLSQGDGDKVKPGDYLVADYVGQTWEPGEDGSANVFDNSYDRGTPAGFPIGEGAVITGWDEGLVDQQVGSRVLLVIPPDKAYAETPPEGSTIEADDTLVFVVDIVDTFGEDAGVSGTPVDDLPADLPTVTGDGAEAPTIEFPASATPVETSTSHVVLEGDGADLGDTLVVKVLQASYTTKETQFSSWDEQGGPVVMTPDQLPGLSEALEGQKVGTRALVRIAAADNPTEEAPDGVPIVIVVDIIGTV
ncbi:MAG TPA: FKBP-type peptidyl-prolyl cis-trans isomerase [Jiangellaceae bacterium]|nr:FKBP-type peptidyl-prolyl cis-trans isomerase [Jiangellaceae bacterium]